VTGTMTLIGALGAIGLAIGLAVLAVLPARTAQSGVARSLAAIEQRYTRNVTAAESAGSDPLAALPGWVRGLAVRLSPSGMTASMQHRLDIAGNPGRWIPERVYAVKGLGMVVLGLLGALYGLSGVGTLILYTAIGGVTGLFLPDLLLYNEGTKRQTKIQNALADAMDMLTVCVEAGLGFDAALAQVARNTTGPLAGEFSRVIQEMQIGKSRSAALRSMVDRTTAPELRAFVAAMVQAGELGISVAAVLREQAKEMRLKRRQRAEEKAQKVPVKILFPLIVFLFPALFVVIMGPAVIMISQSLFFR
jgi:tight adherence protein C